MSLDSAEKFIKSHASEIAAALDQGSDIELRMKPNGSVAILEVKKRILPGCDGSAGRAKGR